MSQIEYYQVLKSIIYALMLTNILNGWNKMFWEYKTITIYWAHLLLMIALFLLIILKFYNGFNNHNIQTIDFALKIIPEISSQIALYFLVFQSVPQKTKNVNLREFFESQKIKIVISLWVYMAVQLLFDVFFIKHVTLITEGPLVLALVILPITVYLKRNWLLEALIVVLTLQVLLNMYYVRF
jgi:hypothetical protein